MADPLHVLIVGASSGLGEALAYEYAARGARLALFARRRGRLEEVAARCRDRGAREALVTPGDTTSRADVAHVAGELERWERIDRAFLNAGGSADPQKRFREAHFIQCCASDDLTAADFSAESAEWIIRVNYLGVVYWLDPLLRRMRPQGAGTITVTGSMAADGNLPRSGPYTASKTALRMLLQGLRHDARKFGVSLCLIECGWFDSELTQGAGKDAPFIMPVAEVAARVALGTERGEPVMRFPWPMRVISRAGSWVPRRLRDLAWDRVLPPMGPR